MEKLNHSSRAILSHAITCLSSFVNVFLTSYTGLASTMHQNKVLVLPIYLTWCWYTWSWVSHCHICYIQARRMQSPHQFQLLYLPSNNVRLNTALYWPYLIKEDYDGLHTYIPHIQDSPFTAMLWARQHNTTQITQSSHFSNQNFASVGIWTTTLAF